MSINLAKLRQFETPLVQSWIESGRVIDKIRLATLISTAADIPFVVSKMKIKTNQKIQTLINKLETSKNSQFQFQNKDDVYLSLSTVTYLRFFQNIIRKYELKPKVHTVGKLKAAAKEEYRAAVNDLERLFQSTTHQIINVTNLNKENNTKKIRNGKRKRNNNNTGNNIRVVKKPRPSFYSPPVSVEGVRTAVKTAIKTQLLKGFRSSGHLFRLIARYGPQVLTGACILFFMYRLRGYIYNSSITSIDQLTTSTRDIIIKSVDPSKLQCEQNLHYIAFKQFPDRCTELKEMAKFVTSGCAKKVGFSNKEIFNILNNYRALPCQHST